MKFIIKKKPEMKRQSERLKDIGKRITFAYQENSLGYGHAILMAREFVGNEPFLVLLGDHVYHSKHPTLTCSKQLVQAYLEHGNSVTSLTTCLEQDLHLNGIVKGKHQDKSVLSLEKIVEKPSAEYARNNLVTEGVETGTYLCFFGIDLLLPEIFDKLQHNLENLKSGELQLRDGMHDLLIEKGMLGLKVLGNRYDTGNPIEYAQSIHEYHQIYINKNKT